jgi:CRISPR/Cas system-associated exonuclease Cas4 (RecB family)
MAEPDAAAPQPSTQEALVEAGSALALYANDAFARLKRSRIKVAPPLPATRASSLGHDCERFQVYQRTQNHLRVLHDERLQAIFDLGNELETYTIREMENAGIAVLQRGRDWFDERLDISGHVDCSIVLPGWEPTIPVEIKGLNPATAGQIESAADIKDHRSAWVRRYYGQLQTYLLLEERELGMYALLDKGSGWLKFMPAPLDYEYAEHMLQRAERIRDHVRAGTLPDRVIEDCERCGFRHICAPDMLGEGTAILSDEVGTLLDARAALAESAAQWRSIDEEIKGLIPAAEGTYLAGGWAIRVKGSPRKAFTVAAGTTYRRSYTRIEKGTT